MGGAAAAPLRGQNGKPLNVLWLSCEDISPDLGCYGDSYAVTPNLDAFAKQSVRFTNAFSVYGVCAPSRSSIITGMYPTTIGTLHMRSQGVPPPEVKCFTEYLRASGYFCTNNVKTDYNFDPPATAWDEVSNRATYLKRPSGQPFFSVFNNTVTHESQVWATDLQRARNLAKVPLTARHDPAKATLPPYYPDTPVVRRDWARYYDNVTAMDIWFGEKLKELDDSGEAANTVVFFWSDHGRGLSRAKRWPYDSGTRVPLMVRFPDGRMAGTADPRMVSLMDLGPTVLSLAGMQPPKHMQARAFLGEHAAPARPFVVNCRDRMDETYDRIRAIRDSRYRYIRNFEPGKPYAQFIEYMERMPTMQEWRRLHKEGSLTGPQKLFMAPVKPPEELYDSVADPHEVRNLAADPAMQPVLRKMRAQLDNWMKETGDLGALPEEELKERMRPGGKWQVAETPVMTRSSGRLELTTSTPGGSIAYTFEPGKDPRWQLYSKPVSGRTGTLRAKTCRLGWTDSPELVAQV